MSQTTVTPDELFAIDSLLTGEEREIRDSVRGLVQRVIAPHIPAGTNAANCRCATSPLPT